MRNRRNMTPSAMAVGINVTPSHPHSAHLEAYYTLNAPAIRPSALIEQLFLLRDQKSMRIGDTRHQLRQHLQFAQCGNNRHQCISIAPSQSSIEMKKKTNSICAW
ncbi:unnamed protein product [Mortierella alpina]